MAYRALYREFRPDTFDGIVGQEPIVRTLKNQVANGRTGHAYLFCGPRGTGKTSAAKVLARAINCRDPKEGSPCGRCAPCEALGGEGGLDILEIDAASNNGVDEVRDLREKARFLPQAGRYKVYIIDEVHMLSPGAFNALLKTLEEPPAHVVFILATTEAHRLPATIISRCQRFDFKRIALDVMIGELQGVLARAKIRYDQAALLAIARAAEGSMRDALSIADQCASFGQGEIDGAAVRWILGSAGGEACFEMTQSLLERDFSGAFMRLDQALRDGADALVLARELAYHARCLLIVSTVDNPSDILFETDERIARYQQQASIADRARLIGVLERFSRLEGELRYTLQPRVLLELAIMQAWYLDDSPAGESGLQALAGRIERLEARLSAQPGPAPARETVAAEPKGQAGPGIPKGMAAALGARPTRPAAAPEAGQEPGSGEAPDALSAGQLLEKLLKELKGLPQLFSMLSGAHSPRLSGDVFTVELPMEASFFQQVLCKEPECSKIEKLLAQIAGRKLRFKAELQSDRPAEAAQDERAQELVERAESLFGDLLVTQ